MSAQLSPSLSSESLETAVGHEATVAIPNETQISALLERIITNKSVWSIGDQLGVAYYFVEDRLFKQSNVVNRNGTRNRVEVRNLEIFFEKLKSIMLPPNSTPYVEVQLCAKADVHLMYCHSKLHRLEPERRVLLLGKVALIQGHFNSYYAQPQMIAAATRVKLYGRTFNIRVSSNQHCIYLRTEDIIKDRVRLEPMVLPTDAHSTALDDATNDEETSEYDNSDSDESDFERDSDSNDSIARPMLLRPRPLRQRHTTFMQNRLNIAEAAAAVGATATPDAPYQNGPGRILRALLRHAATQTEQDNDEDEEDGEDNSPANATRQRPHSA